jgi:hypothetical protein
MVATHVLVSAFHVRHDLFNDNFVIGTTSGVPEARQQVKVIVDTAIDLLVRYPLIPISADMFADHRLGRKEQDSEYRSVEPEYWWIVHIDTAKRSYDAAD